MPQSYQERSPIRRTARAVRNEAGWITTALILGTAAGGLAGGLADVLLNGLGALNRVGSESSYDGPGWKAIRQEGSIRVIPNDPTIGHEVINSAIEQIVPKDCMVSEPKANGKEVVVFLGNNC